MAPTAMASTLPSPTATATPPSTAATTTTARGPLTPSLRPRPIPMSSTAASATPATTDTPATATATPPSTAVTATTTARGALTPSPRLMPTTAITATPAPTDTPTTAKCTSMDLRSSTGRRDQPTQQYSMKCDEPTITSKLPKKRPAPCALSLSQSTKLPLAETVLMMSARKKQNTE